MLRLLRSKKAQNTMEYAILIAVVVGAFSVMQIFMKRGIQSRLKGGSDNIPSEVLGQAGVDATLLDGSTSNQYEPYYIAKGAQNMTSTYKEGTTEGTIIANTTDGGTGEGDVGGVKDLSGRETNRYGTSEVTGVIQE